MNLKLCNFIGIISFLPIWVFRANLNYTEVILAITFFFLLPCFIHFYFVNIFLKKNKSLKNISLSSYLSLVSFFGIDQHVGLMGMIPHITNLKKQLGFYSYLGGHLQISVQNTHILFLFLILIIILFLFIFYLNNNAIKILTVLLITLLLTNILDFRKNISSFPKINVKNDKNIKLNLDSSKKKLVIIFDEMSGINSLESKHPSGLKFTENIKILFDKYKFSYYVNARSVSTSSVVSIPSMLNFIHNENQILTYEKLRTKNQNPLVKLSKNYFSEFQILQNKFFDNQENENIVVYQSLYLDYCKHNNVIKCYQFNPFDRNNLYIEGFNNNFLSRSLSAYTNSLSVIGKYLLRVGRQLNIADSYLDLSGQRASFPYLLNQIANGLETEKANLFFAHYLVPHRPYYWDEKCNYDGSIESKGKFFQFRLQNMEDNVIHHNIERNCIVYYLDTFLKELSKKAFWEDLEIFIISDHGARLLPKNDNFKSVIFAVKTGNIFPGEFEENLTSNYLFDELNN